MKVKIDESKCIGCGICANICPQGIEIVGGKARIKDESADCLKDAANACPQNCIIIEGEEAAKKEPTRAGFTPGAGQGIGRGAGRGIGGRGRGRMGGFAAGPSGNCVCLSCGHKVPHQRGMPCYQQKCPKCGNRMTRG